MGSDAEEKAARKTSLQIKLGAIVGCLGLLLLGWAVVSIRFGFLGQMIDEHQARAEAKATCASAGMSPHERLKRHSGHELHAQQSSKIFSANIAELMHRLPSDATTDVDDA